MSPQPQPVYAPLSAIFSQPLPVPDAGHAPAAIEYVPGMCLLLDDGGAVHAFTEALLPMWNIQARSKLYGWVLRETSLYVQDGAVLAQYDLRGLLQVRPEQTPVPENAIDLERKQRRFWSIQQSGGTAFADWVSVETKRAHTLAVWSGDKDRIFVLSEPGVIHSLPGDLVETERAETVRLTSYPPDLPLRLCVPPGSPLLLQYLSSAGKAVVLVDRPLAGDSIQFRRTYPPDGGAAHWLNMSAAAAAAGNYARRLAWQPEGAVDPIFYAECDGPPASQIFAMANAVAIRVDGNCVLARLDAPGRFWTGAPLVAVTRNGSLLYGITSDGKGDVRLEQFRLPSGGGSGWFPRAWPTAASQLSGIGPWLRAGDSGGAIPCDADSSLVCYAAAARVLGFSHATYLERLPAAAGRAARGMVEIAARTGVQDAVGAAIAEVSAVPALLDAVAGWSYSPLELARRLKQAGIPGRDIPGNLLARGVEFPVMMTAMHDAGFTAADIMMGMWPASMEAKWWAGRPTVGPPLNSDQWTNYLQPSQEADSVARAMYRAGYTAEVIPASCRTLGPNPEAGTYAAISIFRILFGNFSGEDVESRMIAAGHNSLNVRWCLKFIYNYPLDARRYALMNGDAPPWVQVEPFFLIMRGC